MQAFAYISIIEVVLKLLIVYILVIFSFDKLKLYGILLLAVTVSSGLLTASTASEIQRVHISFYIQQSF